MKDQYYADNRDLIKWGGIVHLCEITRIKHVIQAAYFRASRSWPQLNFNGKEVSVPEDVITHFRSITDIKRLGKKAGITIDIVKGEFSHAYREAYTKSICQRIQRQTQHQIVFLDPDNGLAPQKAKAEHVKSEEISSIWQRLKRGDYLVLYQHKPRIRNWRTVRKKEMAIACKIVPSTIRIWEATEKIKDVVFFYCKKEIDKD
jgi:hypothetical protein